ncbi:helix-turn-helix domain-containing protein [Parablastomonas sp. CN1-191]|uniref:helix-turn-helix domain-containing protein n=1 Tax=Parablastomonas sp. CN1-191 TaxID=3400908 RepID=UPI003BF914CF
MGRPPALSQECPPALSQELEDEIRASLKQGASVSRLAADYSISRSAVYRFAHRG